MAHSTNSTLINASRAFNLSTIKNKQWINQSLHVNLLYLCNSDERKITDVLFACTYIYILWFRIALSVLKVYLIKSVIKKINI